MPPVKVTPGNIEQIEALEIFIISKLDIGRPGAESKLVRVAVRCPACNGEVFHWPEEQRGAVLVRCAEAACNQRIWLFGKNFVAEELTAG